MNTYYFGITTEPGFSCNKQAVATAATEEEAVRLALLNNQIGYWRAGCGYAHTPDAVNNIRERTIDTKKYYEVAVTIKGFECETLVQRLSDRYA